MTVAHPGRPARAAWAGEVLVWTGLMWGVWLLSVSAVGVPDLVVGGLCALVCGVCAAAARRAMHQRWRPGWSLLAPVAALPAAIVVDTVVVLLSPWRSPTRRGEVRTVDAGAAGHSGRSAARRAVVTAVVSAAPSTVVLDADDKTGALVVHAVGSPGPSIADRYAVRR